MKMKLLLGSQSPRRRQLLKDLGYHFKTVAIDCQEIIPNDILPENAAAYISNLKAEAHKDLKENEILLTADTVVVYGKEILGKPKDISDATKMLLKLSGNSHIVYTAFTLKTKNSTTTSTDFARVHLNPLTTQEIKNYVEKYNPMDKAGAYGIQEWLGMAKIKAVEGSFYTIMGLPTHLIYDALQEFSLNLD